MNNQEGGTTDCGHDEVPPVKVIQVNIEAKYLNAIRDQIIAQHPGLAEELPPSIPVHAFIALEGNKVIAVASDTAVTFVPTLADKYALESLIPIALFVGKGSHITGCSVGSKTSYFTWT